MGADSKIAWTHHTFNPWEGCEKVSPGCKNCYAEARDNHWHRGENWGPGSKRFLHTDSYWKQPVRWDREAESAGERRRVFCASLGDVFEDRRDLDILRTRLWALVRDTPGLDWLLLTKRPQHAERLWRMACPVSRFEWFENIWLGTTAENQQQADLRLPEIMRIRGPRVKFASCEPLLEGIDIERHLTTRTPVTATYEVGTETRRRRDTRKPMAFSGPHEAVLVQHGLDWVIGGGESGPGARPCDVAWLRSLRDQCRAAGVPYFNKQLGARAVDHDNLAVQRAAMTPGVRADGSVRLHDKKGGDPAEWPADLRVREFPEVRP